MIRRLVPALAAALLCLSQQPAAPDFSSRMRAAADDSSLVVPLILELSAALPKLDGEVGRRLSDEVDVYLKQVFFSPSGFPGAERLGVVRHEVQPGELPGAIAKRYSIGAGMLRYLNDHEKRPYDERKIGAGTELRALDLSKGELQLIVDTRRYRLAAWHRTPEGPFVLSMYVPVGLGAPETPTPFGTTKIVDRVRNPDWTDPITKKVFPHGDAGNVLGGFWIRLDEQGIGRSGIGFHGFTGAPLSDWLTKGGSNGCVRLQQKDIERVFELAVEGTKVTLAP